MVSFVVSFFDRSDGRTYVQTMECESPSCVLEEVKRISNDNAVILSIYAPEFDEFYEFA